MTSFRIGVDIIRFGHHLVPHARQPRIVLMLWILFVAPSGARGADSGGDDIIRRGEPALSADADQGHWAFQPLRSVALRPVAMQADGWPRTPIDHFILARLADHQLQPGGHADRYKLIRRAYFDLVGLPPPPAEVAAFAGDDSSDAYVKLVARLLDSKHYGERWARHWLDVARFGESNGYEHDEDRPAAFHYRDFVIKALNEDMPYDQFVRWQLAGDLLVPDDPVARAATGFLVAGVENVTQTRKEFERERYDQLDDMVSTVGTAMLGMTIGCARCHDHKYDPLTQRDYYRLVSSFARTVGRAAPSGDPDSGYDIYAATEVEQDLRRSDQKGFNAAGDQSDFVLRAEVHLLERGDVNRKQEVTTQGFPKVLTRRLDGEHLWRDAVDEQSFPRIALADWITDVEHGAGPLLARVIVNRLWQHHMGSGIVATPSDFGTRGSRPTHPDLLEWLAGQLVANGWRLKPIHKLIMTSAVYMQARPLDSGAATIDPENRLHWQRTVRRLEAEIIRDAMLAVSGLLDESMFGAGSLDQSSVRRSIYFTVKRSRLIPSQLLFDAPDALQGIARRPVTTVAPQALMLLNSQSVRKYAAAFRARIDPSAETPLNVVIRDGFRIALARDPNDVEQRQMEAFVRSQLESSPEFGPGRARQQAVTDFCQLLFCSNEFSYVE